VRLFILSQLINLWAIILVIIQRVVNVDNHLFG
jgi:hypothetical protein